MKYGSIKMLNSVRFKFGSGSTLLVQINILPSRNSYHKIDKKNIQLLARNYRISNSNFPEIQTGIVQGTVMWIRIRTDPHYHGNLLDPSAIA